MQHETPASEVKEAIVPITPQETRAYGLGLAVRGYTVVRHVFVQNHDEPRPSLLGHLVKARRHRALVLYLLVLCWWPWLKDNYEPLPGDAWLRALTVTGPNSARALTWSPSTLSRTWADLEELGLIEKRTRDGRRTLITPRREDAAAHYTAPSGQRDWLNTYFTLPDEFWTDEHFAKLSLPALAVLLIILKETTQKSDVALPRVAMPAWYGISGKTIQKGLDELRKIGLLHERTEIVRAPMSANGITRRQYYSLTGPFGRGSRRARQNAAKRSRRSPASAESVVASDAL